MSNQLVPCAEPTQLRNTLEMIMRDGVIVDLPSRWNGRGMKPQAPYIESIESFEWLPHLDAGNSDFVNIYLIKLKVSFKLIGKRSLDSRISQYMKKYANMNSIVMFEGSYEVGGGPAMILAYSTYH